MPTNNISVPSSAVDRGGSSVWIDTSEKSDASQGETAILVMDGVSIVEEECAVGLGRSGAPRRRR